MGILNGLRERFQGKTAQVKVPGCPNCRNNKINWKVGEVVPEHIAGHNCLPDSRVELITINVKVSHSSLIREYR